LQLCPDFELALTRFALGGSRKRPSRGPRKPLQIRQSGSACPSKSFALCDALTMSFAPMSVERVPVFHAAAGQYSNPDRYLTLVIGNLCPLAFTVGFCSC
jgi:hypothetical protein